MSVNAVGIPTRDRVDLLEHLVDSLCRDDHLDRLIIMDNGHSPEAKQKIKQWEYEDSRIEVILTDGLNIYQMWNLAYVLTKRDHPQASLTLLNDDVAIPERFLFTLAEALRKDDHLWVACPDHLCAMWETPTGQVKYVKGTFRQNGMCGFAFTLNLTKFDQAPFDEGYVWWAGDDDFVLSVDLQGGKIGRVIGLPIAHVGSATGMLHPEITDHAEKDVERFREKWGTW